MRVGRVAVLTALILCGAGGLYPCGGPAYYPVDAPFTSYEGMLNRLLGVDAFWGPYWPREVTFYHPLDQARPPSPRPAPREAGDTTERTVMLAGFRAALEAGDLQGAERAARGVVDSVLDMEASRADDFQRPMRRAVEFLELKEILERLPIATVRTFYSDTAPADPAMYPDALREAVRIRGMDRASLAAWADSAPRSPRAPSLRFVALQQRMKREIPNGWPNDIRKAASPDLWQRLQDAHDRWLADFPSSPLADLVRLSRLRLYYLSGDVHSAWQLLLDFYPDRRYARVVNEMHHLMANEAGPDSISRRHPHMDGPLRAATLQVPLEPQAWCALWRDAESHRPAGWAVNIEERLLYTLAEQSEAVARGKQIELPACFPATTSAPTAMWGRLRLMVLLGAGREPEAREQLSALDTASDLSALRARVALEDRQWTRAALTPGLDSAAVLYLLRVLAPDTAVAELTRRGPLWVRREAALSLAVGRAAAGDWAGGAALLQPQDAERAARWTEAARLAADSSVAGQVAFARYLHRARGGLMYARDGVWLRSVLYRVPPEAEGAARVVREGRGNPVAPDEPERVVRHLLRSTEDYLALRAYAAALERASGQGAVAPDLVAEADAVYRSLIDWQYASNQFWYARLHAGAEAAAIRRAGRQVRGR